MRRLKLYLLVLTILSLGACITSVYADPPVSAWIATFDTSDNPKVVYQIDETVRINAYCSSYPYNIWIQTRDSPSTAWYNVKIFSSANALYQGDHTDITFGPEGREYRLGIIEGVCTVYAVATMHVIPELPLGTLTAIATSLGALLITYRRRRN